MPSTVRVNAWTGEAGAPTGSFHPQFRKWALGEAGRPVPDLLGIPAEIDLKNWRDPRVGWGVVLPFRSGLSSADLAAAVDGPQALRDLVAQRSAEIGKPVPVLRFQPELGELRLRRPSAEKDRDVNVTARMGMEVDQLPRYLLLVGSPAEIPWRLQYVLASQHAVGRLDLDEEGLSRYLKALAGGFTGASADPHKALVWSVVHGPDDITQTLRAQVGRKVHQALAGGIGAGARFLDGKADETAATRGALAAALAAEKPALVVTTSHGQTGPLSDPAAMAAALGLPVDQSFKTLSPDDLLAAWQPDGAIWYAHACCSAGSAGESYFAGLFEPGSDLEKLLSAVAALGSLTAPLPRCLLGCDKPLRAFIGHVEPTFDWTLRDPETGQPLSSRLCDALFPELYQLKPVGLAFDGWQRQVDAFHRAAEALHIRFDHGESIGEKDLFPRLAARDVESTVILGDPTAVLPAL
ncbi:MAG TPA: hypothetical protein VF017_03410 [Thermoanaerobaculia bacterium]|nr:hypothetical protein [Thermoanaerobaculia bacterium]